MELTDFLNCLFDENEYTCFSAVPHGTTVYNLDSCDAQEDAFFSINPLWGDKDLYPTEEYHSSILPRRADHNVVCYRNILIEMDGISLEEQKAHMNVIKLPYSTCVYSGGKSYHWIISLSSPCLNRKEYDQLVKRIYGAVGNALVDKSCKNPSRLSRLPFHLRRDTDRLQTLKAVNGRINNELLEQWLTEKGWPFQELNPWEDITYKSNRKKDFSTLTPFTKNFLMNGATHGEWNFSLFKAAADLCRHGWNENEAYEELLKVTGTLDKFDERTISSAFSNQERKNENV